MLNEGTVQVTASMTGETRTKPHRGNHVRRWERKAQEFSKIVKFLRSKGYVVVVGTYQSQLWVNKNLCAFCCVTNCSRDPDSFRACSRSNIALRDSRFLIAAVRARRYGSVNLVIPVENLPRKDKGKQPQVRIPLDGILHDVNHPLAQYKNAWHLLTPQ
jgi:hypothetical protein